MNILGEYKITPEVKLSYKIFSSSFNKLLVYIHYNNVELDWPLDLNIRRLERNQWYRTIDHDFFISMYYTIPDNTVLGTLWIDNFYITNRSCLTNHFSNKCILIWRKNGKVLNTNEYLCEVRNYGK